MMATVKPVEPRHDDPEYGLYRVEDHRRALWRVEIYRRGETHIVEFPDHAYGSSQAARAAAACHRDTLLAQLPPTTMREWATKIRSNNTSGVSGVCRIDLRQKLRNGSVSVRPYWLATFNGKHSGRTGSRMFSVAKYGEQGAYERAVQARKAMLEAFVDKDEAFAPRARGRFAALTQQAAKPAGSGE